MNSSSVDQKSSSSNPGETLVQFGMVAAGFTVEKTIHLHNMSPVNASFQVLQPSSISNLEKVFTCSQYHGVIAPYDSAKVQVCSNGFNIPLHSHYIQTCIKSLRCNISCGQSMLLTGQLGASVKSTYLRELIRPNILPCFQVQYTPTYPGTSHVDYFEVNVLGATNCSVIKCVGKSKGIDADALSKNTTLVHNYMIITHSLMPRVHYIGLRIRIFHKHQTNKHKRMS